MSDVEKILVSLMKAGNSFAFEKLYFSYSKKLYNFAFNILKSREDAEGIVQNVFTKIWEIRSEINTELSFGGYIFRIAKNMLLNQLKKKINEKEYINYLLTMPEDYSLPVEQEINFLELNLEIERLISEIPEKRREIFRLSRHEGLTYREIAEKMNISVNTVNTQISKSLEHIRDHLAIKFYPIRNSSE
jgi:RNA polymerase sigma-70 factor (ECF subfamily)